MRTLKIVIAILFAGSLLSSCVSSKKYNEAVSERRNWEQKYSALEADYGSLQRDKQRLEASASNEKMSLTQKEKALSEEQKKLQELKDKQKPKEEARTQESMEIKFDNTGTNQLFEAQPVKTDSLNTTQPK